MNAVKNLRALLDAAIKRNKTADAVLQSLFDIARAAIETGDPSLYGEALIEIAHVIDPKYMPKIEAARSQAVTAALARLGSNKGPSGPSTPSSAGDTSNNAEPGTPGSGKERLI